ncbi:GNAT family N-acetyltransferase [Knoellia koreensis]|uniref:GNAT family N-acetyltransferase n=1 Tax=Knoellia koreensis TaxID=2730921 RepID=A0A849HDG6_9MICO|nr:GNAT family N-acetyltransferase [Knoellia sp. DB2414S]NNM45458.1 GNAT family N-acetyltransferase [Knoellia sp. DB2414S]
MGEGTAYLCREVGEGDLGDLARMRTDWTVAQGGEPADGFEDEFRAWWERESGHRRTWVALDAGGTAVGMVNLMVFERMPRPGRDAGRWAYVANVWVDEAHRRRGVGRLLMTAVVDWSRAERMVRIVLSPSEMSLPLYTSLGFRPADNLLRLDL